MSGINTGILTNAHPLTEEQIKQLEKKVLENQEAFAYLNENNELCFAVPRGIDQLKNLAWHNTYELTTNTDHLAKKHYVKDSPRSYILVASLQKQPTDDKWSAFIRAFAPGLYQPGTIALYKELGEEAVTNKLIYSWDELLEKNAVVVTDGILSSIDIPYIAPKNLPAANEYGFYYDTMYSAQIDGVLQGIVFHENGSVDMYTDSELVQTTPAGEVTYEIGSAYMNGDSLRLGTGYFSTDGVGLYLSGYNFYIDGTVIPTGDFILPNDGSITSLGNAFANSAISSDITGIIIPDTVTAIDQYTLGGCPKLTTLNFYDESQLTTIGDKAFYGLNGLKVLDIPASVTSVGKSVFSFYSSGLDAIYFKGTIEQWCNIKFKASLFMSGNKTDLYINNNLVTDLVIPSTVTKIGAYAFEDYNSLTSVTVSDGVTSIGTYAFSDCANLATAHIPSSVTSMMGSFSMCDNLEAIYYGGTLAQWCGIAFGTGEGVIFGSDNAVIYINGEPLVGDVVIPNTVTEIEQGVFNRLKVLTSVSIPNSVTSIGDRAFYSCSGLKELVIPGSVKTIGNDAFRSCTGLTTIICDAESQLTTLGSYAFMECTQLTDVILSGDLTAIPWQCFDGCTNLQSITIPASVTELATRCFEDCSSLATITFGGTIAQWNTIKKGNYFNKNSGAYTVYCIDGTITKSGVITQN